MKAETAFDIELMSAHRTHFLIFVWPVMKLVRHKSKDKAWKDYKRENGL